MYPSNVVQAETLALAEMLHRLERRRNDSFAAHSLANPTWLLYLTLFIAYAAGATPSLRALKSANMMHMPDAIESARNLVRAGLAVCDGQVDQDVDAPIRLTQSGLEKLTQFLLANLD